nr:LuxR family transcriptional regulator [uncultured Prevotella sp.]
MESIEFYNTPEGVVMYKPLNGPVQELTIDSRKIVTEMMSLIRTRYPEAFKALSELYSSNELNRYLYEFNIVSRFCRCNLGEYDALSPDIDSDGFFHFEEVGCPLRGECRYEGGVCKPKLNTQLSERELEISFIGTVSRRYLQNRFSRTFIGSGASFTPRNRENTKKNDSFMLF